MKRVLFVDDDPAVLDALRLRLRCKRGAWDMEFARSGADAVIRLEQRRFDVIVTEQRMAGMDGAALLQLARTRWPTLVRIVWSGYSEPEQTLRLLALAHQFVNKPCEPSQLEDVIERCLTLQQILHNPNLREIVGRMGPLPPAPRTFAAIEKALASESTSVSSIAAVVAQDTLVSAKLLQIVNSGFFRLPRRITSVEQAIAYLGLNVVKNVVISAEVFARWPETRLRDAVHLGTVQSHALSIAATAAEIISDPGLQGDTMLAALVHDIGYWVLVHHCSRELHEARELSQRESLPMDEAERAVLGASHAEIGAYLLGLWGFPNAVVEAVAHHHAPLRVKQAQFDVLSALCVAHALSDPSEAEAFEGLTVRHTEVSEDFLRTVHAPFSWEEAKQRAAARMPRGR